MANVYAVKNGNWSDTTVWNTGALPTTADDVYANNFRVNVDQSATVRTIRNINATGIAAGGGFNISTSGITLTANNGGFLGYNASILVDFLLTGSNSATLVGDITPPTIVDSTPTVRHATTGILNIIGNLFTVSRSANSTVLMSGTGTLNLTGNLYSSTTVSSTSVPIRITGNCIVNVTGDLIWQCSVSISSSPLILITSACTLNVTGMVNSGVNNGIQSSSNSYINIVGPLIAGRIVGGTIESVAVVSTSTGATNIFTGPFVCTTYGTMPFYVARMHIVPAINNYFEFRDDSTNGALAPLPTGSATRLVSAGTIVDAPTANNVRLGVSYGNGAYTGTCVIPSASNVALNVQFDTGSVGTAFISANDITNQVWGSLTANLTGSNTIGERLKNASTVSTTGAQIASF